MKAYFVYISLFLLCACSTQKDKFINRKYHALITKYNVLYNGKHAYQKGVKKVQNTYQDDYTELLPIEPFSFYAELEEAEDTQPIGQEEFKRAEEKATKAIQRHSMFIDGEERNPQIDETYLLLGKSRYYTKRFGPALESFEYVIKNYPEASLIYETVVWRAKSNIHLNNIAFAKKALQRLLGADLSPEVRQQAELGLVMAYQKSKDSLADVIQHLEKSLEAVNHGAVASRAAFVLGQAYQKQGKIAQADKAFNKVIDMKGGLYKFKLQSKLEKINNHLQEDRKTIFLEDLDHLIFITKNRPYLGKLYYQKGVIYVSADSLKLAKQFFTKSILKSSKDIQQKILSYEKLGDLYFDKKQYRVSKSYYDSLIDVATNKQTRRLIRVQRISKSLEKVVSLEEQATVNDSLLQIAKMDEAALTRFFEQHIETLKEQEKLARIKEIKALEAQNQVAFEDGSSDWYFFNNQQRTQGKKEFLQKWKLTQKTNTWYASSLKDNLEKSTEKEATTIVAENNSKKEEDNPYKVSYYIRKINRSPEFLDSIFRIRNISYYELGNIYYNQLKEKELAVEKLEKLLAYQPNKDLKVGAYYRLYKMHQETGALTESEVYRRRLNEMYPNSSFTKLANNQNAGELVETSTNEYTACYKTIYELYQLQSFEAAKEEVKLAIQRYNDTPLAAKFHLLQAYIEAKTDGKEKFYDLLKEIKLKYPNTEESLKAMQVLNNN